ncbi:sigma-54-dependent transcriptional regulator [Bacillus thermotolerans]|uniref:sigma-54-dependent transcriptional regulator n=1 Tax=Bacillus thermotolerans TaxID=1221996 RepID=UPI00269EDF65|nr:sigma-54 dependent transcriptional regulator [Bacillus thermotolerans]
MKALKEILIVEDELEVARFLSRLFKMKGYETTHAESGRRFHELTDYTRFQLAFIDVRLPDCNGLDILQKLRKQAPLCPCVIMTGYSTVKTAVEAIKSGAADFIEKPFEDIDAIDQLVDRLTSEIKMKGEEADYAILARQNGCFLGTSSKMHQLYELAYKIASKDITILIEGETGTGKEVLANYLHAASSRRKEPFIGINCGAISESLLESELFGHVKGAFTGATTDRVGYFEAASAGTLFLDEIAEASPATQVKLLRVLETGEFMKIGGTKPKRTSARIIAASHVNLEEAVEQGSFREDLLYRLNVVKLSVPPLRERREDIPQLIESLQARHGEMCSFSPDAMELLIQYDWPGNIRELSNIIRRSAALASEGTPVTPDLLPAKIKGEHSPALSSPPAQSSQFLDEWQSFAEQVVRLYNGQESIPLADLLQKMKKMEKRTAAAIIHEKLKETAGNRDQAAERLGLSKRQIRYYLNEN